MSYQRNRDGDYANPVAGIVFTLGPDYKEDDEERNLFACHERAVMARHVGGDPVLEGLGWTRTNLLECAEALQMTREEACQILAAEIAEDLAQFYDSEQYQRYLGLRLTDGAKVFATMAGAYWLLDVIASVQCLEKVKAEPHQFWTLLRKGSEADVFCHDGNLPEGKHDKVWRNPTDLNGWGRHLHYHQHIDYTDIVFDRFELYAVVWGGSRVVMLPSEY